MVLANWLLHDCATALLAVGKPCPRQPAEGPTNLVCNSRPLKTRLQPWSGIVKLRPRALKRYAARYGKHGIDQFPVFGQHPRMLFLGYRHWLFAARYKAAESESASVLMVSTLALAITAPAILWLSNRFIRNAP